MKKAAIPILAIGLLLPSLMLGQEQGWTREEKLRQIQIDIAEAEAQKKSGLMMLGAGLGLYVLGYALFFPSYDIDYDTYDVTTSGNLSLWYVSVMGGLALEVYGGWQWWDGAQRKSRLEAKKYDITLKPIIKPNNSGSVDYAFALQMNF